MMWGRLLMTDLILIVLLVLLIVWCEKIYQRKVPRWVKILGGLAFLAMLWAIPVCMLGMIWS